MEKEDVKLIFTAALLRYLESNSNQASFEFTEREKAWGHEFPDQGIRLENGGYGWLAKKQNNDKYPYFFHLDTEVVKSWGIIESALDNKAPHLLKALNSGAPQEDINRLERELGWQLPEPFKKSLLTHNGANNHLFDFHWWWNVDDIISDYRMLEEISEDYDTIGNPSLEQVRNVWWAPGWLKFTDENGYGWVLDLNPGDLGRVGQIFYRPNVNTDPKVYTDSFESFLAIIATRFLLGQFKVEDGEIDLDLPFT